MKYSGVATTWKYCYTATGKPWGNRHFDAETWMPLQCPYARGNSWSFCSTARNHPATFRYLASGRPAYTVFGITALAYSGGTSCDYWCCQLISRSPRNPNLGKENFHMARELPVKWITDASNLEEAIIITPLMVTTWFWSGICITKLTAETIDSATRPFTLSDGLLSAWDYLSYAFKYHPTGGNVSSTRAYSYIEHLPAVRRQIQRMDPASAVEAGAPIGSIWPGRSLSVTRQTHPHRRT
ncbi:hypothetical protein BU15DRAFT_57899 [Melanogaster broomeanus]|nr:hypothetical protein BU15DRAFT_57899 [Melanogaster broomeanus]